MDNPEEILQFWFGEPADDPADGPTDDPVDGPTDGPTASEVRSRWFASDAAFDAQIRRRFAAQLARAAAGELAHWQQDARSCLALIVLLDQFSRNIFRGTAQAFAQDALALAACRTGLRQGLDRALSPVERAFFYLPLEHAEDATAQRHCVQQFEQLAGEMPESLQSMAAESLKFALSHKEVIDRFGRFPHRNAALGRQSTAAELEFLQTAAKYGQ